MSQSRGLAGSKPSSDSEFGVINSVIKIGDSSCMGTVAGDETQLNESGREATWRHKC